MKKKILAFVMALIFCCSVFVLWSNAASGTCGNDLRWTLSSGTLQISGVGDMENYSTSNQAPWYTSRFSIKRVVISSGVTSIGKNAFSYCNQLLSVDLPSSLTYIGDEAFHCCFALQSIDIPDGVQYICEETFSGCHALTSVTFPDNLVSIEDKAFFNCHDLLRVTFPEKLESIGASAFFGCEALNEITFPRNLEYIDDMAFASCEGLTSIKLPSTVSRLGKGTFTGCYRLKKAEIYSMNVSFAGANFNDTNANLTIYGYNGSTVKTFATQKGITFVAIDSAVSPVITSHPCSAEYEPGNEAEELIAEAYVIDGGTLSYQWYVNDTDSNVGGKKITGATKDSYTPSTSETGKKYYYVVITNTNSRATGTKTAKVTSRTAEITIKTSSCTVRGSIISQFSADSVTIELFKDGIPVTDVDITVTTDSYSITNVTPGTYVLRVSKPKHVTREYTVVVGDEQE